jgi:predicted GNAT family acetyltransferase
MRLDRYERVADFLAAAGAYLVEREAEHNLMLGLSGNLARGEALGATEGAPYFSVITESGRVVLAAFRTPPWNLLLSEVGDEAREADALALLAEDVASQALPGVIGPPAAARRFAGLWTASHPVRSEVMLEERIYRLEHLVEPPRVPGVARRASQADRRLVTEWFVAFHDEALPAEGSDRARRTIEEWDPATGRQFWFWVVDGREACLVGAGSPTPNGIRIGPVYTPPEHRRRGYASALTAFVSGRLLSEGRRFCFLYTDLANVTANRIYQAIGYRPVTDALMLRFVR